MFSGSGLFWLLPFLLLTINAKEKPMAEKKVVGRLVNTVSFQTDRASLQKALADIKKVKDAMKGLVVPAGAMKKQTVAMKQQVAAKKQLVSQDKDWLIVQRAINKNKIKEEQREKRILDSKAKGLKLTEKQTKANQRQQQIARKEAVARLTQGSGMKVNDMLFMRMSKQAEAYNKRRDDVLSRRDSQRLRRRINRSNRLESLHGQALGMNAAYDRRKAEAALKQQRENEARWEKALARYTKRRDDVLSRRDAQRIRRRINRSNSLESLHGQALRMNAAYDRRQASIHSRALAENAKRDRVASQNAANAAARRKDMFAADRFNLSNRFGSAGNRRFDEIASRYAGATSSLRMYRQEVSALRRDLSSAANAQRGFNGTMKDMRSAFVQATASYTAFAGLMGIANVGKSFQGFQSALTMGFGGESEAAPMIEYLRKEIRRLGLDIKDTTDDFSKLAVAAKGKLSNPDIQNLFSGYMEYANVAGAGKERTSLGMRAMQQMLSKGQIMAEEFRSQLNLADYKSI